jgi:acyl-CoA reductase-like NAD-dependent aldehyde dehydrogenase
MDTIITEKQLVPASLWQDKIYSGGWREGRGGVLEVTDKSSGESLGRTGLASPDDVASAVAQAKEAQKAWRPAGAASRRYHTRSRAPRAGAWRRDLPADRA